MNRRQFLKYSSSLAAMLYALPAFAQDGAAAGKLPNIVYILCDDLGYGDVSALNRDSKINTPNIDKIASAGMIFTDAHSGSAVCTPTRYGILTGRYAWRTHLRSSVLGGESKSLISSDRLTVGALLKQSNYHTACIGKWHLGMNFAPDSDHPKQPDYTQPITNGPTDRGFDYYFGVAASADMPPYAFVENTSFPVMPTEKLAAKDMKYVPRRPGMMAKGFVFEDIVATLTSKACNYISERAKTTQPFFLYLPLTSPHTPIAPSKEFVGKSGINAYADFVLETDDAVGKVLDALDKAGVADNTLVIFTSDNGCSPQANFEELKAHGHNPSYIFRGMKADTYDGGHHVPLLVRWPGNVKAGSTTSQLTCLTDLIATCAEITQTKLPESAAPDSFSMLPTLLGLDEKTRDQSFPLRDAIVHQSINGSLVIRQGDWKLIFSPGSGGWSDPKPDKTPKDAPPIQLFNLKDDIAETTNVQDKHPDIVDRLTKLMQTYINNGRTTPGPQLQNDVPVPLFVKTQGSKE